MAAKYVAKSRLIIPCVFDGFVERNRQDQIIIAEIIRWKFGDQLPGQGFSQADFC
jgi:hypothetical protein